MAIGLGSMLGFRFIENFNYPFISKSATEFWRRWHMSLGSWFRDYVYIPLGGSRCSRAKHLRNVMIVWMLTGFWHGVEWTFVVWGLYFGILLILEKTFFLKWLEKYAPIGHLYSVLVSVISFVIFDSAGFSDAWNCISSMFGLNRVPFMTEVTGYYLGSYLIVFAVAIVGATPLPKRLVERCMEHKMANRVLDVLEPIAMMAILLIVTGYLVDGSFNPFLYFRF